MKNLTAILNDISPYVIVTGSYAFGSQTSESDIDFYVKQKTDEERDRECVEKGIEWCDTAETYVSDLIRYFEHNGYSWSSCFPDSFVIDSTEIPLEFSSFYSIDNNFFDIEIFGVKMVASKSNYTGGRYKDGSKQNAYTDCN